MADKSVKGGDSAELIAAQLGRMRGMLFAYSALFFRQMTIWTLVSIALLALSAATAPILAAVLPFLVPFAFLEAGYLFYYTVFARRHAEFLERTINARHGGDLLVAHRLEAAYFYPPERAKLAFLSFGRLSGYGSVATLGYTFGALMLWGVGVERSFALVAAGTLPSAVLLIALAWTLGVALYLLWHFIGRRDEERLLAALRASYPDAVRSRGASPNPVRPRRSRRRRS